MIQKAPILIRIIWWFFPSLFFWWFRKLRKERTPAEIKPFEAFGRRGNEFKRNYIEAKTKRKRQYWLERYEAQRR